MRERAERAERAQIHRASRGHEPSFHPTSAVQLTILCYISENNREPLRQQDHNTEMTNKLDKHKYKIKSESMHL